MPIGGSTSVRDVVGSVVDGYFFPVSWMKLTQQTIQVARAGLESVGPQPAMPAVELAAAKPAPHDPYLAARQAYQTRLAQDEPVKPLLASHHGRPPPQPPAATTIVASNP